VRFEIRHRGGGRGVAIQHFLVYAYTGDQLAGFPEHGATVTEARGCLAVDLGPPDRDRRQLVASGTATRSQTTVLPGGAPRLAPVPLAPGGAPAGLGFVLDGEWLNTGSRTRTVSVTVVLRRARGRETSRVATMFSDDSAGAGLLVAPGAVASTEALPAGRAAAWGPGLDGAPDGDLCVVMVTGQMHKRGRFLGVDLIGADGHTIPPTAGVPNPFEPGRQHLFGAFDWTDMGALVRPFRLGPGERLHYACWADDGSARTARLGCEEVGGVPPGSVGSPAKPCDDGCPATDPAYPGRTFTGACVAAYLVAGPGLDDEVCRLDGVYAVGVPCGSP